jgi:hypothetical protein
MQRSTLLFFAMFVLVCGCESNSNESPETTDEETGETTGEETGETTTEETGEETAGEETGEETAGEETGEETTGEETGEETAGEETGEETAGEETGEETAGEETGEETAGEETGEGTGEETGEGTGEETEGESGIPADAIHVDAKAEAGGTGAADAPYSDLQLAIDEAPDGATLYLHKGTYIATPQPYADPGCGNCDDNSFYFGAEATRGFLVQGKSLHLLGAGHEKSVLVTKAGYGLLFDEAGTSSVRHLRVTGGLRDADGNATDAGIVVRHTTLTVEHSAIVFNNHLYTGPLPDPVVGIGGIFGREGSDLTIRDSIIEDNSWDGITLYRGEPGLPDTAPTAFIEGCLIGCTTDCVVKGGRGAGIGVTWDAQLMAIGNTIHHYWKGIGTFGDSSAVLSNNVVRDQVGWGVIASGSSTMHAINNVIVRNGTTGLAAWNAGVSGSFINNIIFDNGWSEDEWVGKKTGLWFNAWQGTFILAHNLVFGNADFDACIGGLPNEEPCLAMEMLPADGHVTEDPLFAGPNDFHLLPGSPAIDAGDPELSDLDGTPSDMGVFGGANAPDEMP